MNKPILERFERYAAKHSVDVAIEEIEWEDVNLVNDSQKRIQLNPAKNRRKIDDLIKEKKLGSKIPMDQVDEKHGVIKIPIPTDETKKLDSASYRYFEEGDIIWAKVTPCMENGNCAIVSDLANGIGYGSTEFHVFRGKEGEVDSEYLWYFLRSRYFRDLAKPSMTGSGGLKRVPKSFLESQNIPVPIKYNEKYDSLAIQKILVDFIKHEQGKYDHKLKTLAELYEKFDQLEKLVVPRTLEKSRAAMEKFDGFAKSLKSAEIDFEKVSLSIVADVIMGQSPSGGELNDNGEGIPFHQGKSFFGDKFLKEPQKWTTKSKKESKKGDILISMRAPAGVINIASYDTSIGRGLAAIRPKKKAQHSYLYHILKHNEKKILDDGDAGGIYTSITADYVRDLKIIIPKEEKHCEKLSQFFDAYIEQIERKKKGIKNLETLIPHYQDAFIQTLFTSLKNQANGQ